MSQLDIFGSTENEELSRKIKTGLVSIPNGEYIYLPNFFSESESDHFFQTLKENIVWKQ